VLALHNRFAYPVTGFAATMLALALALRPKRRGHLTLALVEGIVVTMTLFGLLLVGKALVLGEHLPAFAAAWSPIAVLLILSGAMWWRAEGQRSARR
jgi:lipopolysaccharide export system permease protein